MVEIGILGKKFIVDYMTLFVGGLMTITIITGLISAIGPYLISILPEWVKHIFKEILSIITLAVLGRVFYYYKIQKELGILLSIGLTFFTLGVFVCAIRIIWKLFNVFDGLKLGHKPKKRSYLDPWEDDNN